MKFTNITFFILGVALTCSFVKAGAEKSSKDEEEKSKWRDAFESDSDFMKGFETGIFLRTKGGSLEEYGCSALD